jgi:hypothetical protein
MVRKHQQDLRVANSSKSLATAGSTAVTETTIRARISATARRQQHQTCLANKREASHHNDASNIILTPATAVTPTTPMMPVEAGTPTAANDFSGNSHEIFKWQQLIPLILSTYNRNGHISLKNSQITIFLQNFKFKKN